MRVQRPKIEAETFGSPRDPRATSRKLLRLDFLRQPPLRRQQIRAEVQERVNAEIRRRLLTPSALAKALANGQYDEPRAGELADLEAWASGNFIV